MRWLLIDANIYLSFYRFSKDDLEELRKLAELVRQKEIQLYVNQQLRDEFRRNRETVLAQSFKTVTDARIPANFPQMLRNYDRFNQLTEARRAFAEEVDRLVTRARDDAAKGELPADAVLDELMALGTDLAITDEIIENAKARFDRGNPPGKDRSYGDAITWETLLANHSAINPLDLVTADSDYLSPLQPGALNDFLQREWQVKMFHPVAVYESLSSFLAAHFPDIKLSSEVASELAVARLIDCGSFHSTHLAIAALSKISDFSAGQVQRMIDAALNNDQITMVLLDADVKQFYDWLLDTFGDVVEDPEAVRELQGLLVDSA